MRRLIWAVSSGSMLFAEAYYYCLWQWKLKNHIVFDFTSFIENLLNFNRFIPVPYLYVNRNKICAGILRRLRFNILSSFHKLYRLRFSYVHVKPIAYKPGHSISYKTAWAHSCRLTSLRYPHYDALDSWLPTECPAKNDQTARTRERWALMQSCRKVVLWPVCILNGEYNYMYACTVFNCIANA